MKKDEYDIEFCIYCQYKKRKEFEGYDPKPEERLCPICGRHLWYLGFDLSPVVELSDYDECGVHANAESLMKLFKRAYEILEKEKVVVR